MSIDQQREHIPTLSQDQMWLIIQQYASSSGQTLKKTFKQISSKCYEVTLSLSNKKSIGFGRNQKDASVNALRKLIEHISGNEIGAKILSETFNTVGDEDVLKTEVKVIDLSKFNQKSSAQVNLVKSMFANGVNKTKINLIPSQNQNHHHHQRSVSSVSKNFHERYSIDSVYQKSQKQSNDQHLIHQLREAKTHILKLERQLQELKQQNKRLRGGNGSRNCTSSEKATKKHSRERVLSEVTINNDAVDSNDNKKKIPKLNFESLPGFHGNEKSRKSLNQSMMLMLKKK